MKRPKTLRDHLRYYTNYAGTKPKRRVQTTGQEQSPAPQTADARAEEERQRARDKRSIAQLEARVKRLEGQPKASPGLDLARQRLEAAQARRATRMKEQKDGATTGIAGTPQT